MNQPIQHGLQAVFASGDGEAAWSAALHALFAKGDLAGAERLLTQQVATLDSEIGTLCRAATRDAVVLKGWDELIDAAHGWPGEPITGITLGVANEPDLAFDKGVLHAPYLLLGLYADTAWPWSRCGRDALMAEAAAECPAWAGSEEDIEVFLELTGLDPLNTALIHHKQRFFIREGSEAAAPLRYVDYVLGCWWRALRFHQAVSECAKARPLPGQVPVLSGLVELRPEVPAVHWPAGRSVRGRSQQRAAAVREDIDSTGFDAPDMAAKGLIQRNLLPEPEPEVIGSQLRRRFALAEPEPASKRGLLARMFGRG